MEWLKYILSIVSGIVVAIPLVIKLFNAAQTLVKERKWADVVNGTIKLMKQAEGKFKEGAARKIWVMDGVKLLAGQVDYNLDEDAMTKISNMIDAICAAAKIINTPTAE